MILSIHMPRAAGTSLSESLHRQFGERLLLDYGDAAEFTTPQAIRHRAARTVATRQRAGDIARDYDAIHGHFIADKYMGLFPDARFIAVFRDPYEQALSDYVYLSTFEYRYRGKRHAIVEMFRQAKMTFEEFLVWDVVRNPQSQLLGSLGLDALAVVGIREQFGRTVALINRRLGLDLRSDIRLNAGFDHVPPDLFDRNPRWRPLVDEYRDRDLALYRSAKERFEQDALATGL